MEILFQSTYVDPSFYEIPQEDADDVLTDDPMIGENIHWLIKNNPSVLSFGV